MLTPPTSGPPEGFARHAERNLPRYTSYPTALAFHPGVGEAEVHAWAAALGPDQRLSVYVHIPFCRQLCWYCGCHTSVPNGYRRIGAYARRLKDEIALWAAALGQHGGAAHLHFGGGSPNALEPDDFRALVNALAEAFRLRPDAEIAVELDPRTLDDGFIAALGAAGVTRASLGVQTFDPEVQAKVNRIQPYELVADRLQALRAAGVGGINFDLMYGLPGQTPASVGDSARLAAGLGPDRISVFGYAHVPWFKKHQALILEEELAGLDGRWAQADAADEALAGAGYERIGLDHYARPGDELSRASREGRLRRNFQGYTTDPAEVLIPIGQSAIGRFPGGYVQSFRAADAWAGSIARGRLPIERGVATGPEDRLRARVIERLMCDLTADVGAICRAEGFDEKTLDEGLGQARALEADGLCRVDGRQVQIPTEARRLMRAPAACFDAALPAGGGRHSRAV
jgi:oxygen-independent coproporphyrinogen III oxidase